MDADLSIIRQNDVFANNVEDEANDANDEVDSNIPEDFRRVIHYLTTFERPEGLTRKKYLQFQRFATKFLLQDGVLFWRARPNIA